VKVDVLIREARGRKQEARKWRDIERIVRDSSLPDSIRKQGLSIFRRLFEAEAKVHGSRYDRVHLHELGAVDCLVDIFGSLIGIHRLGIDAVYASAVNVGSGSIASSHGTLPVPAPASLELLKGVPLYSSDTSFELTTPTGAALISSLAQGFGPLPEMTVHRTGSGSGDMDFKDRANILRLFLGESQGKSPVKEGITVIETNIDDMNPQIYDHVMDRLFRAGALDVFLTQIMMKKNRPGIMLTVLCDMVKRDSVIDIILRETSSIGVRFYGADRRTVPRVIETVDTEYGKVRVKKALLDANLDRTSLEYDDCRKIARKFNIPLIEVMKLLSRDTA
jgi:uncharacterized protein (TIGR00299 family) protein